MVGGVEGDVDDRYRGVVSLDLGAPRTASSRSSGALCRLASRRARPGPDWKTQLGEHGLTLRHFPQSFEFSTLGGWVADAGRRPLRNRVHPYRRPRAVDTGHHAQGRCGSHRRLPGSGAGPSPDRFMLGSEGIFGVITEAWMRGPAAARVSRHRDRALRRLRRARSRR